MRLFNAGGADKHDGGADSLRERVYRGDVVRWNEGVWQKLRRRRGRLVNIGDRIITAEVLQDEGGWLDLLIRGCAVASEKPGHKVSALAANVEIRRKRHTVEKGKPERLRWSDETARAALVSKFLG
jgi:hypothetical protein